MRGNKAERNKGAVTIMEAAFVFPVMFIIILTMIIAGEVFYERANVEQTLHVAALDVAASCSNPMQQYVLAHNNKLPKSPNAADVMPYRYILTGNMKEVCKNEEKTVKDQIGAIKPLAFGGVRLNVKKLSIEPENYFVVSYVKLKCDYEIELPIRMIFTKENFKFAYSINITQPVGDSTEFVRNVGLVTDLMERSAKIQELIGKIGEGMQKMAKFLN